MNEATRPQATNISPSAATCGSHLDGILVTKGTQETALRDFLVRIVEVFDPAMAGINNNYRADLLSRARKFLNEGNTELSNPTE